MNVLVSRGATESPLAHSWLYWREGGATTLLRTDALGNAFSLRSGGDRSRSWDYTTRYDATSGAQVDLYFSRGAKPIPDSQLSAHLNVFHRRTVPSAPTGGASTGPIAPNNTNNLALTVAASLTLPDVLLQLSAPAELSVWPLLWELPTDAYHTDGLPQGAALWGAGGLAVAEHTAAAAPGAGARPRERGLKVAGRIDAGATGAILRILDAAGNVVSLRESIDASAVVLQIDATLGAPSGASREFAGSLFFASAVDAFGPVQILVESVGMAPPILEAFAAHLCGFQIALVDDHNSNATGQQRGPILGEGNEIVVVDFLSSPQPNLAAISAQSRARRMAGYQTRSRSRALGATNPAMVETPEMPLWMSEFQIVGLSKGQLEDLMLRRRRQLTTAPTTLRLRLEWRLTLSWDGPDISTGSPRLYSYSQDFNNAQDATITLAVSDQLDAVDANGQVSNALNPAPPPPAFPVAGRRRAHLVVSGQSRPWGRRAAAASKESILVEWQPAITDGPAEIIRGGDGVLTLRSIALDGTRIDPGLVPSGASLARPPPADPDIRLPRFRTRGGNPPTLPANALIDALVEDYFNSHAAVPRIALLPLDCWQETTRRILAHEAGRQFESRGVGRRRFGGQHYGHQQDMPYFGAPHGYGYGQHDNPPVSDDGAWSFLANLRESVRRIMDDKASAAYAHISGHIPVPADQATRAVYQRELVRRYNGGREFQWNGAAWEISPSLARWANPANHAEGPNQRLPYPNRVLGTAVVYFTGAGAATLFPWPIVFAAAAYGPGT